MKILLTGATGFVGYHVLWELNKRAINTVAVTRDVKSCQQKITNGCWLELDIAHPHKDMFSATGCPDALIHLAWDGLPNYGALNHFEHELPIQYEFIKMMVKQGLKHVVVAGTCFEYGLQSGELCEDLNTSPSTPYGFAKDMLKRQLEFLQTQYEFTLSWARLFYLHGKHQFEKSLFPQLKAAANRGDKIFNMSGGEQLRDYMPVDKAAQKLVDLSSARVDTGPVNIASGRPVSVRVLVERWIEENRWDIKPNLGYYPYPSYEPMAFWGSTAKLKKILQEFDNQGKRI